ncbi:phosphatidylinositol N-acetylglucosaminyltransferase [Plasmodium brasilianum]|uniref:Phosphatidylinositol N-acetylglucosaminyltransferase n=1 Tax=Plasmodium brasilianum TaxID=5824 RepID=A0ACB9YB26_PLABR|nr:phosphatidylinositol N-acetylglucosaminyltransferase [Plasmodium brasilianum]
MLCVNHQIIVVFFLLLAYYCIDKNITSHKFIYVINIIIIILKEILIYETHRSLNSKKKKKRKGKKDSKKILSPVLISLTQTHSDDTVYLVSLLLLLTHLMFHNYGFIYEKNENIDIFDATSLSCVVIASVILGSRLSSILQLKNINYYNYVLFPLLLLILSLFIWSISVSLFYISLIGKLEGPWDICGVPSTKNRN